MAWWVSILIGACSAGGVKIVETLIENGFASHKRKSEQRDADVDAIRSVTFEVRDLAKAYWEKDGRDHAIEGAISGRLLFIGATIEELFNSHEAPLRKNHIAINAFDRACTDGSFATAGRRSEPWRAAGIESAAYTLVHSVQRGRREQ